MELIQTISTAKARGQVEKWLKELERIMKETVLEKIFDAYESYASDEFGAWITHWPGQFVCIDLNIDSSIYLFSFCFRQFQFRCFFVLFFLFFSSPSSRSGFGINFSRFTQLFC